MAKKPSKTTKSKALKAKTEPVCKERRGEQEDRRTKTEPVAGERRKVQRRRQIDPTTCERDYTADEIEFMDAMDAYKRANGRMFPTCSEILEVVRSLGYERTQSAPVETSETESTPTDEDPLVVAGTAIPGTTIPGTTNDDLSVDFTQDTELLLDD